MGEPGRTLCSRAITYASSTWTGVWASYTIRPPDTSTMRTLGDHAIVHPCPVWVHVEARGRPLSAVSRRPTHSTWPSMTRESWASTERYVYSHMYVIWASTIRCTWPHPPTHDGKPRAFHPRPREKASWTPTSLRSGHPCRPAGHPRGFWAVT